MIKGSKNQNFNLEIFISNIIHAIIVLLKNKKWGKIDERI